MWRLSTSPMPRCSRWLLLIDRLTGTAVRHDGYRSRLMAKAEVFPPDVVPKLKTYVYQLIDPRNGETFYVGKGHTSTTS